MRFASGVIASAAVLILTSASPAQHGTARDYKDFAKALSENTYFDLAKEVVNEGLGALQGGDDKAILEYALCEISANEAFRTPKPEERQKNLEGATKAYEDYLKKYPSSPVLSEARYQISELLRSAGEAVARQLKDEKDATKKDQLREKGLNYFTKAEAFATQRVEELKAKQNKSDIEKDEFKALRFAIPVIAYSKVTLYDDRNSLNAQVALKAAKEGFEDFDLEYTGELLSFEARRYLFLIAVDEKRNDEAEELIAFSCDQLAEAAQNQPEILQDESTRDVMISNFHDMAQFLTQTKAPPEGKKAIERVETLLKAIPRLITIREGRECLLILARAYAAEGQADKGKKLADDIFKADPSGPTSAAADELRKGGKGFATSGGGDLSTILVQLQGCVERKDTATAEKLLGQVFARDVTKAKIDDLAEALFLGASTYFERGNYVDASVCFGLIVENYPQTKRAPPAASNAAMAYGRMAGIEKKNGSGFEFWKNKNKEAIADLIRRYPQSPEAAGVTFFAALDAEAEGKLPEAIDLFGKVPGGNVNYPEAQFRIGKCATDIATQAENRDQKDEAKKRFTQAVSGFENAITSYAKSAADTLNKADIAKARRGKTDSQLMLSQIYLRDDFKQVDKALGLLDNAEADNKDDKNKVAQIWNFRVRAFVKQGQGTKAADLFKQWLKQQTDAGAVAPTAISVAAAVDKEAGEKVKANDKSANELYRTAAEMYTLAIDSAGRGGTAKVDWSQVGGRLLAIAGRLSGLPDDLSLSNIDPNAKLAEQAMIEKAKKAYDFASEDKTGTVNVERLRNTARCRALTGDWIGAISALTDITTKQPLFMQDGKLDAERLKQNPSLPAINLDLAVAYIRAGKSDKSQYSSASDIARNLIANSEQGKKMYWEARYLYLLAMLESGNVSELDGALDSLERTNPEADKNEYGIKAKIDQIRAIRNKKAVITK